MHVHRQRDVLALMKPCATCVCPVIHAPGSSGFDLATLPVDAVSFWVA